MRKYRKKPIIVEATQWFKNGDHPEDRWPEDYRSDSGPDEGVLPERLEGRVVRYFRRPDIQGTSLCSECGKTFHVHGWIDTLEDGHRVCPGDWIITGVKGEKCPCKPDIFEQTYEKVEEKGRINGNNGRN